MDVQSSLDSLLGRLTTVLVDEAQLLGGLRGDVEFIKDEMESMHGLLMHLTDAQHRDHQVRAWMKQVLCLSRDCEGNAELYIQYVAGAGHHATGLRGCLRRILQFVQTMAARHRVATRIKELKVRARDVGDRRMRYGITVPSASSADRDRTVADEPAPQPGGGPVEEEYLRRRELLFRETPDAVDTGTEQLLDWLLSKEGNTADNKQLPIFIIIEGWKGTGKTTIARKILEHSSVTSSFDHQVWINFGGLRRGYHEVRGEILKGVMPLPQAQPSVESQSTSGSMESEGTWFEKKSIELLQGKRLLMVLDDPCRSCSKKFVDELFEDFSRCGWATDSAVIATSRSFHMIQEDDARFCSNTRLDFFRATALALAPSFCESETCQILDITAKCHRDEFASRMLLHLLYVHPHRSSDELATIDRSLETNKNTVAAKKMLMFCYNELPSNYKGCLLYLSIYPHLHKVRRKELLRRWC